MTKFNVILTTTASTFIEVEADNEDDAVEAAFQEGTPSVCAQCSGWGQRNGIELAGDWDVEAVDPA